MGSEAVDPSCLSLRCTRADDGVRRELCPSSPAPGKAIWYRCSGGCTPSAKLAAAHSVSIDHMEHVLEAVPDADHPAPMKLGPSLWVHYGCRRQGQG